MGKFLLRLMIFITFTALCVSSLFGINRKKNSGHNLISSRYSQGKINSEMARTMMIEEAMRANAINRFIVNIAEDV